MVTWFSLKPTKTFTKQQLKEYLHKLALFHYEKLDYRQRGISYSEHLHEEFLDEEFLFHENPSRMNFKDVFFISSCDPTIPDSYRCDDVNGAKQTVATRNLRKLRAWDSTFEQFELQSNYEK